MIFHIPHSSMKIPDACRGAILLTGTALRSELLLMTDSHTERLFQAMPEDERVIFPVSRLVVDPERFEVDDPMDRKGMGAIYTMTSDGRPLRASPSPEEREQLFSDYYRPHHSRLVGAVDEALSRNRKALIIDCHSFPSVPLPYEEDTHRPDVCFGTDEFHTPKSLTSRLLSAAADLGLSASENRPFAGSLVPMKHYRSAPEVVSVMVEVNRNLYMDESTGLPSPRFDATQSILGSLLGVAREYDEKPS